MEKLKQDSNDAEYEVPVHHNNLVQTKIKDNKFTVPEGSEGTYWRNILDGGLNRALHQFPAHADLQRLRVPQRKN